MTNTIKPLIDVSGMICQIDEENNFSHAVCRIRYIEKDTGDFEYIFTPNYSEIDELGEELFDGIQGLDLSRRQKRYVRTNRTPVFISERVPANNREDVRKLIIEAGMEGKSKLEWLMNTHTQYPGDRLIVRQLFPEEQRRNNVFKSVPIDEVVLSSNGNNSSPQNDSHTTELTRRNSGKRGRPRKAIDPSLWEKISDRYLKGELNAKEASGMLEISESTLFRMLRNEKAKTQESTNNYSSKAKGRYANRQNEIGHLRAVGARFEAAQAEIDKLDGAEFQRLCTRYIRDKYGLDGLTALGAKPGTYGTVQGTPDAFWEYPDGSFLVMEAGHYSSKKSSAKKKILSDIQKCVDYEKEHLMAESIKKIVICYSCCRFSMVDIQEIHDAFPNQDIDLIGPDELAASVTEDFPWIGREILGISYKSHAVMAVSDFIDSHKNRSYRAPLDMILVGREDEKKLASSLLEEHQIVIVSGDSGAGKTRFAIEIIQEYGALINSLPIVVQATKEDISEELMLSCKKSKNHIILLDDANEISRLSFLPNFLRDNPTTKLVATVRSYAFETVKQEFRDTKMAVLPLERLQEDKFDNALENAFQISDPAMRKIIADQSHGNLRLAYFIHNAYSAGLPENVSFGDIIKECYSMATELLSENEKNAIRVSSILGPHRTFDNEDLDALLEHIDMKHQTYIHACIRLCEREMMDSVQNVKAVSFEEQNLRDYFIYEGLIASQIFSLRDIWSLIRGEKLLLNVVNVLLQVFPGKETEDYIKQQLSSIWNIAQHSQKKDLIIKYNSLLGSKGLRYLLDQAELLPSLNQDLETYKKAIELDSGSGITWLVKPLLTFAHIGDYQELVLKCLVDLIAKDALSTADIEWISSQGLQTIHLYGQIAWTLESRFFDQLWHEYQGTNLSVFAFCIVILAKQGLKDELSWTELESGNLYTHWTATLNADDEIIKYRQQILEVLKSLFDKGVFSKEILNLVFGYSMASSAKSSELFARTAEMIVDVFSKDLLTDNLDVLDLVVRFRQKCIHYRLNNLSDKLAAMLETSAKSSFFSSLLEEKNNRESNEYIQSTDLANKLNRNDWQVIIESLSTGSIHSKYGTKMLGFFHHYMTVQDSTKVDWFCDAMLTTNSYPYGGDAFYESIIRRYGVEEGRQLILDSPNAFINEWLQGFDEFCLSKCFIVSNPNDYIKALRMHDELLSLKEILIIENTHKGFLNQYLFELKEIENTNRFFLWTILPHDNEERNSIKPYMDDPEVASIIKKLVLKEFEADSWAEEELAMFLFEHDRSFIVDLLRIDLRINECSTLKSLSDAFWANYTEGELLSIKNQVEDFSHDYHSYYRVREWLKVFTVAAFKLDRSKEALNWLRTLDCDVSSKYGIWAEIVCSLSDDLKIECLTALCGEDIDRDLFCYIAFNMSFEGQSWSGSESSIVLQDIDFAKQLKKALKTKELYKYVLNCDEYIEYCEEKLRNIEIEDFINDW